MKVSGSLMPVTEAHGVEPMGRWQRSRGGPCAGEQTKICNLPGNHKAVAQSLSAPQNNWQTDFTYTKKQSPGNIYLFYHVFPWTQHTSFEFTATCFDLTSHLQVYLWTLTSYNLPVRIWDPRWLTCVFAYNVISMYSWIGTWRHTRRNQNWSLCETDESI